MTTSARKLTINSTVPIPNFPGQKHPVIGFGVYLSPLEKCKQSCLAAISAGYRCFDTAQYYDNEEAVGDAIRESGLPREEFFVTTKVLSPLGSVEKTLERCRKSIDLIGLGYVDLFLIHSPGGGPEARKEMWKALELLMQEGGTKAIGVSNYGVQHIEEIKTYSKIAPAVNQVELHPWCQQRPIADYCRTNGILVEAYCPIRRGDGLNSPVIKDIAQNKGCTPAQVLVRWSIQKGYIPLPKSDNPERIKENCRVFNFELTHEEVESLDNLDEGLAGAIVPQSVDCP